MAEAVRVGDEVTLPSRYGPLAGTPGVVTEVANGWTLVDCGGWGIFGMPADSIHERLLHPCKNCSEQYDPADKSDPTWGAFVGPRYCGPCGAQEARILAAELGWLN
jgi:hypothetical protein